MISEPVFNASVLSLGPGRHATATLGDIEVYHTGQMVAEFHCPDPILALVFDKEDVLFAFSKEQVYCCCWRFGGSIESLHLSLGRVKRVKKQKGTLLVLSDTHISIICPETLQLTRIELENVIDALLIQEHVISLTEDRCFRVLTMEGDLIYTSAVLSAAFPTCMAYELQRKRLYIGSDDGSLRCFQNFNKSWLLLYTLTIEPFITSDSHLSSSILSLCLNETELLITTCHRILVLDLKKAEFLTESLIEFPYIMDNFEWCIQDRTLAAHSKLQGQWKFFTLPEFLPWTFDQDDLKGFLEHFSQQYQSVWAHRWTTEIMAQLQVEKITDLLALQQCEAETIRGYMGKTIQADFLNRLKSCQVKRNDLDESNRKPCKQSPFRSVPKTIKPAPSKKIKSSGYTSAPRIPKMFQRPAPSKPVGTRKMAQLANLTTTHQLNVPSTVVQLKTDGQWILTGDIDRKVRLYKWTATGAEYQQTLGSHSGLMSSVRFGGSSQGFVASSSLDGLVQVWKKRDMLHMELKGKEQVFDHCFLGGDAFIGVCRENKVQFYDLERAELLTELKTTAHRFVAMESFNKPNAYQLLTATSDKSLQLHDLYQMSIIWTAEQAHKRPVQQFALTKHSPHYFASTSNFDCAKLWDIRIQSSVMHFFGHVSQNYASLCYSNDGNVLMCGSQEGQVCLYDTRMGMLLHRYSCHNSITQIQCHPKTNALLVSTIDPFLWIIE